MGFRSNFITEDMGGVEVPSWFVQKYPKHKDWYNPENGRHYFPIVQPWESKFYDALADTEIFQDIQKILRERTESYPVKVVLILLHECDGITRVEITKDSIRGNEPVEWKTVEHVEHDYCYGCSDIERLAQLDTPK